MKIKPIKEENIVELVRYNPNTRGTHIFITEGMESEKKRDYSNLVLLSLMYKSGYLKPNLEDVINDSRDYVESYESNVKGL